MKRLRIARTVAELVEAGVFDPSIFKAVFLAGSSASGKSYVGEKTTSGFGFKVLNSDTLFTMLTQLEKAGLFDAPSSVRVQYLLENPGFKIDMTEMSEEEREKSDTFREETKKITEQLGDNWVAGRLGIVIDGTGRRYYPIEKMNQQLKDLGYDTAMIFVDTKLETALKRNLGRGKRKVSEDIVRRSWNQVQKNKQPFRKLFGKDFHLVDNNVDISKEDEVRENKKILDATWKQIRKLSKKEIINPIARQWIQEALNLKGQ